MTESEMGENTIYSPSRLEAAAVVAGRLAEMLGAVAAEIGERGEVHPVGYLRERQAFVVEVFLQDGHRGAVDEAMKLLTL